MNENSETWYISGTKIPEPVEDKRILWAPQVKLKCPPPSGHDYNILLCLDVANVLQFTACFKPPRIFLNPFLSVVCIEFNTYSMKQPDLYYFETIKMTPQAQSNFAWRIRAAVEYSQSTLTKLVTSFLWLQNSIDRAVS